MVQTVGSPPPTYYNYGPQGAPSTQGAYPPQGANPYQMDGYSGQSYAMQSMQQGAVGVQLSSIVGDPKALSRMNMFMINSSDRLLKVGAGFGVVGRFFVNMLAGKVPLFTSSAQAQQVENNVSTWLSSADLVRTGSTPFQTSLLQNEGIWKTKDLQFIVNPTDQSVLASRLTAASAAKGQPQTITQGMVANWVAVAQTLTHYDF